jgi:hypothetical protein
MRLRSVGLVCVAYAQVLWAARYADNRRPAIKDSPQVAANFPDVKDIKLLAPAFLDPDTVPAGFAENQEGPTDQDTLGMWHHRSSEGEY